MFETCEKYFLATNSYEGFVSNFEDSYNPLKNYNVYIIKGGPGTGKSSFMKYIGRIAEKRGYNVTFCYCTSDPDSLDGIIIKELKTVILDGTSPHTLEPSYPGVMEEIINLGEFWNSKKLKEKRLEIINATAINKAFHKTAAGYLSAAGKVAKGNILIAEKFIKNDKIIKFARDLCKENIPVASLKAGQEQIRYLEGITPKGIVSFPETVINHYKNKIIISDSLGAVSNKIIKYVKSYALSAGHDVITLKNPFFPSLYDEHIIIPSLSQAIVTENKFIRFDTDIRRIHARRFADIGGLSAFKNRIRFNGKIENELLKSGCEYLKKAKASHDVLEEYYISAMDFEKMTEFSENFAEKILN